MPTAERVVIPCPYCNAPAYMSREAYLKAAGKTGECPRCGQACIIGIASPVATPVAAAEPEPAPAPLDFTATPKNSKQTKAKAKPTHRSPRQTVKWLMVWATSLWIVLMPLLALQGYRSIMYGAKLTPERDAYIQNGERIAKPVMELAATTAALWKGLIVPGSVYLVAMIFLGVLCFALTPEREA